MTVKQEYNKERKRILNYISRLKRQGFTVEFDAPKKPKKPTRASIRALKKITPRDIKRKSYKQSEEGKLSVATARRIERERKKRFKKAAEQDRKTRERIAKERKKKGIKKEDWQDVASYGIADGDNRIIQVFKQYITGYPNKVADKVLSIVDRAIFRWGEDAVAQAIQAVSHLVDNFLSGIWGMSGTEVNEFCAELLSHIPDITEDELYEMQEILEAESW